jgi:hypothetical protein
MDDWDHAGIIIVLFLLLSQKFFRRWGEPEDKKFALWFNKLRFIETLVTVHR